MHFRCVSNRREAPFRLAIYKKLIPTPIPQFFMSDVQKNSQTLASSSTYFKFYFSPTVFFFFWAL